MTLERVWRNRGERYAACNIVQHDWFGGGSVMVWGGISIEGRTDLYRLNNGTLSPLGIKMQWTHCQTLCWCSPASCGESMQVVPGG